ncbi:SRPBCC family protein [Kutzneria sp. CA-103260]|uniref:SRPBCC family protein n=1 Tax=Kutzneria sp. CA-103260 TaxID=2802641 RepID=UPI001BADEA42|nr:SRPBCC family protein [Kutzneria sp. CA-103260]QUQ65074.1 phospholipid-binding protein [Kutzneria sp. CA-103260]
MGERLEVQRVIAATPTEVFDLLCDPDGHVAIDASGMLQSAEGGKVTQVGDEFVVHMDLRAFRDVAEGRYDVTVSITRLEPNALIEWSARRPDIPADGHCYGYRLEPAEHGTLVTSYYDWSLVSDAERERYPYPRIPESALRATLGILARTVER